MRFGTVLIPDAIFDFARARMRQEATFTPDAVRQHILTSAPLILDGISSIKTNQRIVAHRVTRACIDELRASGEVVQLKRGLWKNVQVAGNR